MAAFNSTIFSVYGQDSNVRTHENKPKMKSKFKM